MLGIALGLTFLLVETNVGAVKLFMPPCYLDAGLEEAAYVSQGIDVDELSSEKAAGSSKGTDGKASVSGIDKDASSVSNPKKMVQKRHKISNAVRPPMLTLLEYLHWDQPSHKTWRDLRGFFVQNEGLYRDIPEWQRDSREVQTLQVLWFMFRLRQSRAVLDGSLTLPDTSETKTSCLIGELTLLMSRYVFLPRSAMRAVVNGTVEYYNSRQQGEQRSHREASEQAARRSMQAQTLLFSEGFFERERDPTINPDANIFIELLDQFFAFDWAAILFGVSENECSQASESSGKFSHKCRLASEAPLLAADPWPIFSILSVLLSRLNDKNLPDLSFDFYGFHQHGRESTRTPMGDDLAQLNRPAPTSPYDLLRSIRGAKRISGPSVRDIEEKKVGRNSDGSSKWAHTFLALAKGNLDEDETVLAEKSAAATGGSGSSSDESSGSAVTKSELQSSYPKPSPIEVKQAQVLAWQLQGVKDLSTHDILSFPYHLDDWRNSYYADGCEKKYRIRELDIEVSRITSEGLLFGKIHDSEDVKKCLPYMLTHVTNIGVRTKRSAEADDALSIASLAQSNFPATTSPNGPPIPPGIQFPDWMHDLSDLINNFVQRRASDFRHFVVHKWFFWEMLAQFGMHQIVPVDVTHGAQSTQKIGRHAPASKHFEFPLLTNLKMEDVASIMTLSEDSMVLPEKIARIYEGKGRWAQRLEIGQVHLARAGATAFPVNQQFLLHVWPRYATFHGVVATGVRARRSAFCPREFQDVIMRVVHKIVNRLENLQTARLRPDPATPHGSSSKALRLIEVGPHFGDCMFWTTSYLGCELVDAIGLDIDQRIVDTVRKTIRVNGFDKFKRSPEGSRESCAKVRLVAVTDKDHLDIATKNAGDEENLAGYVKSVDMLFKDELDAVEGVLKKSADADSVQIPKATYLSTVLKVHIVGNAEFEVLRGATRMLAHTDSVVLHLDHWRVLKEGVKILSGAYSNSEPAKFKAFHVMLRDCAFHDWEKMVLFYRNYILSKKLEHGGVPRWTRGDYSFFSLLDKITAQLHGSGLDSRSSIILRVREKWGEGEGEAIPDMYPSEGWKVDSFFDALSWLDVPDAANATNGTAAEVLDLRYLSEFYMPLHHEYLPKRFLEFLTLKFEVRQLVATKRIDDAPV